MSLFWLKTPLKKHLVTFDNKSADIESKQGLKAAGLCIIQTKELLYFFNLFSPNLVAFASESETCKMKRCIRGMIQSQSALNQLFTI